MLFYIYSDAPGSTIDITSRCRLTRFQVKDQAEEGAVAISSQIVDDPDGTLELTGHRRLYVYESEAPIGDQVVANGFTANEREERGPYRTGAGSQWVVDLADPNVLINRRIMNGADANRPAETDVARITALLTMTELNTVDDSLYFSTLAPVPMDAVDYRGQNVGAYIDDCRQASGKNAYIWYREATAQYSLWYDFASSEVYDSGCFLTNTASEANHSTVFLFSQERTYLNSDPSRVASGIYLEYDGGTVYEQDDDTTDEFAAIDWAAPSENVKSEAKATARAIRYLTDAATEHRIIHTVMTKVPRAMVNKVKKGQLVQFKASWMSLYTSYTTCRVLYRTVTEIGEDPQASFEIEMDLDPTPPQCPSPTGTGNFYPLGGSGNTPNLSGGNILYIRPGIGYPVVVSPGFQGIWHFPTYGAGGVGTIDYAGNCTGNEVRGIFVGDGTLTIHTEVGGGAQNLLVELFHRNGTVDVLDSSQTGVAGDDFTVSFSTHGLEFCTHWVTVKDNGPTCGFNWGFSGMDWVAG